MSAMGEYVSPHPEFHPTPSLPHPSGLLWSTGFDCIASCIKFAPVIYFTYGNLHSSMLFSQITPSSPSLRVCKSDFYICVSFVVLHIGLSLLSFLIHIYVLIYCIGVSLSYFTLYNRF